MEQTESANDGMQKKDTIMSTKNVGDDPQLPPPRLMMLTYSSVSGASIAIIIYILYMLLHCGCK